MIEASEGYHMHLSADSRAYLARAITCRAMNDARNAINRKIQAEGRRTTQVGVKEINRLASAMIEERKEEFKCLICNAFVRSVSP